MFYIILNNTFLVVISILKLLSSMYIPLIIISFFTIVTILYLSSRKIVLPCVQCDNGSWWYKCKPGTGYGSESCNTVIDIVNRTTDLYNFIIGIPGKIYRITTAFLTHTVNMTIRWVQFMMNIIMIILKLNPTYFVFKFRVEPFLGLIFSIFSKLINEIKKLDFGFVIPVIDIDINIGKLIAAPFEFLLDIVQLLFETLVNIFSEFAAFIFKEIIKPIIEKISEVIAMVMRTITNVLSKLFGKIRKLFSQVERTINIFRDIKFYQVTNLLFDHIIKNIVKFILLPLRNIPYLGMFIDFILDNPYLIIYIFIIPQLLIYFGAILGQFLSLLNFIKHIIYMLLHYDNDNDFIVTTFNLFSSLFNISV